MSSQDYRGYAESLENIAEKLLAFVNENNPSEYELCKKQYVDTVKSLLNFDKPKVMVYGIYNSGKSTLINALMKKEVAEIADRPMTDRISEYDKGEYILIDSPGIDAPIQHEKVTNEYLNKCHIILFVISSKGGFESRYNYERMYELIEKGIPFVIVLNDPGYEKNLDWTPEQKIKAAADHECELREVQHKIINNLQKIEAEKRQIRGQNTVSKCVITDKYDVIVLNAKKALRGVTINKPQLYEASKISNLELRIEQILRRDSFEIVLRQPVTNLKAIFDYAEKCIAQQMQESHDLSMVINNLRQKQNNIKDEMRTIIRSAADARIDELVTYNTSNNSAGAGAVSDLIQQEIESKIKLKLSDIDAFVQKVWRTLDSANA